jgi:hypothetical protein
MASTKATTTNTKARARGTSAGKIFLSHRREDADESAGRIRDWLTQPRRVPPGHSPTVRCDAVLAARSACAVLPYPVVAPKRCSLSPRQSASRHKSGDPFSNGMTRRRMRRILSVWKCSQSCDISPG